MKKYVKKFIVYCVIMVFFLLFFVSWHNVDMCHNGIKLGLELNTTFVESDAFMRTIDLYRCYNQNMLLIYISGIYGYITLIAYLVLA